MKLLYIFFVTLIAFTSSYADDLDSRRKDISQKVGIEKVLLEQLDNEFKLDFDSICANDSDSCLALTDFCSDKPYLYLCIMRTAYQSLMLEEVCNNSEECRRAQAQAEMKFISFVEDKAKEPGYGRAAVNICMPLHKIETINKFARGLGVKLARVHLGTVYDYIGLFNCVSDTYKKLVMHDLK